MFIVPLSINCAVILSIDSSPALATQSRTSAQHAVRFIMDFLLTDVSMLSHRPKLPDIDLHDWTIQLRPISRQVDNMVSYVLSVAISVTPVAQFCSVSTVFSNAVHAFWMSEHICFAVLSASIPNMDNARLSKSSSVSAASDRHWAVNVVQDWRTSSSFLSWANLICASASSINWSHTVSAISWQFSVADSKKIFLEFKYETNFSLPGALVHVWLPVGRVIKFARLARFGVKIASPVDGSIY